MDFNIVDIIEQEDAIEVKTIPNDFYKVKDELIKNGCKVLDAEVKLIAQNPIDELDNDSRERLNKFIDSCNDNDDIQSVVTNYDGEF
jgi:transcriptional/translational regulatory protein YebC/TACO1